MHKKKDSAAEGEKAAFRKRLWRYLAGITAVLSGGWLILYVILLKFGMLLNTVQWNFSPNEAASIGIIGGADGPTAIFVALAVTTGPDWDVILVLLIFIGSFFAFLRLCGRKQK